MDLKDALDEPVTKYMSKQVLFVTEETTVEEAARLMKKNEEMAAIVTRNGKPLGIVTERDIIYKVVAAGRNPSGTTVSSIMSSPVETIPHTSKSGDALAKMSKLGVRRLGVIQDGKVIGLVVQRSIVSGSISDQVPLPELINPNQFRCPYCSEVLGDAETLSKHIDRTHLGMGLLEGDTRKW